MSTRKAEKSGKRQRDAARPVRVARAGVVLGSGAWGKLMTAIVASVADHPTTALRHRLRGAVPPGLMLALPRFGAPLISFAILLAAMVELHHVDWTRVLALVPRSPAFWLVFAVWYMVQPVCDWLIYRRLWNMPLAGLAATMRKTIGNELLVGYAGEAYLFTWARRAGQDGATAIRQLKDVAILSSVAGSLATLVAAAVAMPWLVRVPLGIAPWMLVAGFGVVIAPPLVALIGRRRLFWLPGPELLRIAAIHGVRAATIVGLTGVLWLLALPGVAAGWWVMLSALKLLCSRLPFISNRELVFAGITGLLLGHVGEVAALMAMMAALTVATHILLGVVTGAGEVGGELRRIGARLIRA